MSCKQKVTFMATPHFDPVLVDEPTADSQVDGRPVPVDNPVGNKQVQVDDQVDDRHAPVEDRADGRRVIQQQVPEKRKKARRGVRRKNFTKQQREEIKKASKAMLETLIAQGTITEESFSYRKVKKSFDGENFKGYLVKWEDTIEPPAAFLSDINSFRENVKEYRDWSDEEIIDELLQQQNKLGEKKEEDREE